MRSKANRPLGSTRKVLLIGDEEFFHWCLAQELQLFGYEVAQALDLGAGEKLMEESAAELVIYDKDFSFHDSLPEVSRWKKKNPKVSLILLTAATPLTKQQLKLASADACLVKPFPMQDFMDQVAAVLNLEN